MRAPPAAGTVPEVSSRHPSSPLNSECNVEHAKMTSVCKPVEHAKLLSVLWSYKGKIQVRILNFMLGKRILNLNEFEGNKTQVNTPLLYYFVQET